MNKIFVVIDDMTGDIFAITNNLEMATKLADGQATDPELPYIVWEYEQDESGKTIDSKVVYSTSSLGFIESTWS